MKTYCNPIARNGDFADPFVLRYNGRYYLYCTNPDVRCWSSDDLVNWTLEGPAVPPDEFPGLVPFAPEVVYHNRYFYMYTSPHGRGHYVLRSESPTGPFRKITGNIGHAIDFSIFVDEDGKWYAYWADDAGILACEMTSPTQFGKPVLIGAFLHGWTEGPFIVKREGKYHLTYTGNHYLSKGYRIHAAVSDHPLGPYRDVPYNPVIVRTEGNVVGLGHSSTVLGPDLLHSYLFYHNLNPDRTRDLNFDEVVFTQCGMIVLGPTQAPRPVPSMAQQARWNGRTLNAALPESGALEINLRAAEAGWSVRFGELTVRIDQQAMVMCDGQIVETIALPQGFRHDALHTLRAVWGEKTTLWLDALKLYEGEYALANVIPEYDGSGIETGYTAVADAAQAVHHVPIPSQLPADCVLQLHPDRNMRVVIAYDQAEEDACITRDGENCSVVCGGFDKLVVELAAGTHTLRLHGLAWARIFEQPSAAQETIAANELGPWDKLTGSAIFGDAEVSASFSITPCEENWEAGLLLHASELANGGEGDDKQLGTNFFIGYRVALSEGRVALCRHGYDQSVLADRPAQTGLSPQVHVQLLADRIRVDVNGQALIDVRDPHPVLTGRCGFHARGCIIDAAEKANGK